MAVAYGLRCTHCGAPLPQPKRGEEYVRCDYCGYVNRVVDSQAYLESLKREVARWLSQLLPQATIASTTADPVARYHLFQAYVKPTLIPMSVNARTRFIEILYGPLTAIGPLAEARCEDPKGMFEDSIKLEAVGELAVDEGSKAFLNQTYRYLQAAAFLCNALRDAAEERFGESAKSVSEAMNYVPEGEHRLAAERLRLAKSFYAALSELLGRNPSSALTIIRGAEEAAERILRGAGGPEPLAPLEAELDHIRVVRMISEVSLAYFESGLDPLQAYVTLRRVIGLAAENARRYSRPTKDVLRVVEESRRALLSRLRRETIRAVGSGDVLVPFYLVEVGVTYTHGLVLRKGRDLRAKLLVAASPPVLSGVSDVFGLYQRKPVPLEGGQEHVRAVESLVAGAAETYPTARVVLPLISPVAAERVADEYISAARMTYGGRIKLSSTVVRELIYVAAATDGSTLRLPHPIVAVVERPDALGEVTV